MMGSLCSIELHVFFYLCGLNPTHNTDKTDRFRVTGAKFDGLRAGASTFSQCSIGWEDTIALKLRVEKISSMAKDYEINAMILRNYFMVTSSVAFKYLIEL